MKQLLILLLAAASIASCKSGDKKLSDAELEKKAKDSVNAAKGIHTTFSTDNNATPVNSAENTTIEWLDSTFIDLGKKPEGKSIEISFRFKNTGDKPLVIKEVRASCGCTVPEKPEKPILPGETGSIKVVFNSKGKVGHNEKNITVMANTQPSFPPLLLTGEVVAAK